MKTYTLSEGNGTMVPVSSMSDALQVMARFEPYVDKFLGECVSVTSLEAEPFAFIQRVAARWNANCEVLKDMEADGDLKLAEKKEAETQRALAIKRMASKCRDASTGSTG